MKNILVCLCIILAISCKTEKIETSKNKDIASTTPVIKKNKQAVFTDFIYDVGTRFNPIKKGDLDTLRSFNDIIGEEHASRIVNYKSVRIYLMEDDVRPANSIDGTDHLFTKEQLKFLQSLDYSTNLMIWADYREKHPENRNVENAYWTPYLTVVPEKQAEYAYGKDVLKGYLKDNSEKARANVDPEKLKPAKLYFTVTKNGTIENIRLDRSSNYPLVDDVMKTLIKTAPGSWIPAENAKGKKVDQELVVSFGLMGC